MISVQIGGYRFTLRAAAVVMDEGFVLLHRIEGDDFWALPGGRVEAGETGSSAVCREMQEELDELVDCQELLFTVENFFHHGGQEFHEIGLYFRTRLSAASPLLDKTKSHAGVEGDKCLEFRWFPVAQLEETDLHPSFLRKSLSAPDLNGRHIVQRG